MWASWEALEALELLKPFDRRLRSLEAPLSLLGRTWEPLRVSWGALGGLRRAPWRKKRNRSRQKYKNGGYVFVLFRKRQTALAFEQKDENGSVLGGLGCSLGRPWEAQEAKRLS